MKQNFVKIFYTNKGGMVTVHSDVELDIKMLQSLMLIIYDYYLFAAKAAQEGKDIDIIFKKHSGCGKHKMIGNGCLQQEVFYDDEMLEYIKQY